MLIFSRYGIGWTIETSVFGYYDFGSICVWRILASVLRILYPRLEMAAASFSNPNGFYYLLLVVCYCNLIYKTL